MEKETACKVDRNKLIASVYGAGINFETLSRDIGIGKSAFSKKVNGKAPFKAMEIAVIKNKLNLSDSDTCSIFLSL